MGERRHPVAVGAGVIAPVGELVARSGELFGQRRLRFLRPVRRRLGLLDACLGRMGLLARRIGRGRGVPPAREQQAGFGEADLVGQGLVPLGLLGLAPQRGDLAVQAGHQVLEAGEIGFGLPELAFGIAPADVKAGDACRLLEHHPPLVGLGGDDRGDLALADEGGRVCAGRRVREHQRDVLRPHVATVDAIGAAGATLDPADDLEFLALVAAGVQHDFGKIARRALRGTGEDHVVHPARAQRFGRILAHHPADRLEQVGLAAAVGADHAGEARLDAQLGRLDEALEA